MVFLSFSGADRLQGKSAQKCGPRPSVPRNRRNSSRVRSERAGAGPLGPRGRGTAAAGRVDGARRARAQIPGAGKGLIEKNLCTSCGRAAEPLASPPARPHARGPSARGRPKTYARYNGRSRATGTLVAAERWNSGAAWWPLWVNLHRRSLVVSAAMWSVTS